MCSLSTSKQVEALRKGVSGLQSACLLNGAPEGQLMSMESS